MTKSMRDVKLDNYGDNLSLPRHDTKKKEVMSLDEIKKIWTMRLNQQGNAQAKFVVDTILMLMYTGVRIDELLSVKTENVNMSDMWFDVVKAKTVNGVRRIPIHPAVYNIFQQYFDEKTKQKEDIRTGAFFFGVANGSRRSRGLLSQMVGNAHGLVLAVAGEGLVHVGRSCFCSEKTHERYQCQPSYHGEYAGVDGVSEHEGKHRVPGHVKCTQRDEKLQDLHAATPYEGNRHCRSCHLFAVETV